MDSVRFCCQRDGEFQISWLEPSIMCACVRVCDSVCVCVCRGVYICINIYMFLYMHTYIYMHIYIYVCIQQNSAYYMFVYLRVCVCPRVCRQPLEPDTEMDGDSSAHVRYPQLLHATWWRCRHRGIRAFSRGAMQELDDELYMATNPTSYREQTKLVYRPCWYKLSFALYFSVKLCYFHVNNYQ